MNKVDMEVYHQTGGTYIVPTEIMNVLLDENEILNKGIDELIKKYETKIKYSAVLNSRDEVLLNLVYEEIIQDLKKLKGSE